MCNNVEYPKENRLECLTCTGDECGVLTPPHKSCETYGPTEKCTTLFETTETGNKITARGCSSTLTNQCTDNDDCLSCDQSNCNTHESKEKTNPCIFCDSKSDPKCVTSPSTVKYCTSNECFSRLLDIEVGAAGQNIDRGCHEDLSECVEPNCLKCTGPYCNNKNFPTNRRSCLKCENDQCQSQETKTEFCLLHNENSQCISVFNDCKY